MIKIKGIDKTIAQLKSKIEVEISTKKSKVLDSLVLKLKEATPVDTGEAREGWKKDGNKIVNEVPHIALLNHGSSQQAPAYFIERTVLEHKDVKPSGAIVRET